MPKRMSGVWARVGCGAAVLLVLGVLVVQCIRVDVETFYSPGFTSVSAADARARGVFVSQPALKTPVVRWQGGEVRIREAWIERQTRSEFDWLSSGAPYRWGIAFS